MDAVRRLPDVRRDYAVGERQGGKQQADAFRRALGQAGEDATGDGPASDGGGGGGARDGDGNRSGNRAGQSGGRMPGSSPPTPSRLQRQAAAGRREDVGVVHVDVYA